MLKGMSVAEDDDRALDLTESLRKINASKGKTGPESANERRWLA